MNFYEVLAAEKWSGGIPTINFFDLLFAQSMGGAEQWETYEGTLPATINANGDDMRQYQVYGNTGGVGDRTENLFDQSTVTAMALVDNTTGDVISYQYYDTSATIDIETDFIVSFETNKNLAAPIRIGFYDEQGNYLGFIGSQNPISPYAVMLPTGTKKIRVSFSNGRYSSNAKMINIFVGPTPPASFVPYGYKLDMGVSDGTSATTTPIYIGDEPLEKDEYVDYGEQKIYRRSNLYDANATDTSKGYLSASYLYGDTIGSNQNWFVSEYMPILAGTDYIASGLTDVGALGIIATINIYNSNKQLERYKTINSSGNTEINSGVNGAFIRVSARNEHKNKVVVKPKNAMPTDPPVPLPALPTCEGETVVSYAGESVAPEKVVFEYKKGGN